MDHFSLFIDTKVVTDQSNGELVARQMGMPFGTQQPMGSCGGDNSCQHATKNNPSKKRFTSYDRSDATGLDYAVNRFYSAAQGRFTQVDPIGMSAASLSNPQSLNLYSYCENDPMNHIDPDGLFLGKLFSAIGKFFKKVAKVFAVILAVAAVLAFSWGFTAIGVAAAIGAGIFALIGWGNGKLAQLATGIAFPGGGYVDFRTPGTFGGVNGLLQSRKPVPVRRPANNPYRFPGPPVPDRGPLTWLDIFADDIMAVIQQLKAASARRLKKDAAKGESICLKPQEHHAIPWQGSEYYDHNDHQG